MNILASKIYDPNTAASKTFSAAAAMAVIDATNLRLQFTIPAHGFVRVRMLVPLTGATTFSQLLLGIMAHSGGAIVLRAVPKMAVQGTALATTRCVLELDATISGLTPGAADWDAAVGCEVYVASSTIKWGGPENTTANDAFGAFIFEVYDPRPVPSAAPGAEGGLHINGSNAGTTTFEALTSTGAFTINGVSHVAQTGDAFSRIGANGAGLTSLAPAATALTNATWTDAKAGYLDAAVTSRSAPATSQAITLPPMPTDWITAAGVKADAVTKIQDGLATDAHVLAIPTTAAPTAAAISTQVWTDKPTIGTSTLTEADIRTALGLAAADLDTQLAAIPDVADIAGITGNGTGNNLTGAINRLFEYLPAK